MLSDKWKEAVIFPDYFTFEEAQEIVPEGYRLPTHAEFEELKNITNFSWDSKEGNGIFTFPDGFELILPAMGYRRRTSSTLTGVGSYGYYWGASPYSSGSNGGSGLLFRSGYVGVNNGLNRTYGFSVICIKE